MDEINRARMALWRNFLIVPHRKLEVPVHEFSQALLADPEFIGKAMLAMNLPKFNRTRDLDEAGTIVLLSAPAEFQILRKTGAWCLKRLAPYQVIHISDFLDSQHHSTQPVIRTKSKGNRHVEHAMTDYIAEFNRNRNGRLEGALQMPGVRAGFRRLFLRYKLSSKKFPTFWEMVMDAKGQKSDIVRQLATTADPVAQAKLAVGKGLSDVVLASVLIPHPATVLVRIEAMSPVDALNARGWLEEDGWLGDPDIFKVWEAKAGQAENASAASLEYRKSINRGTDTKVQAVVEQAKSKAVAEQAIQHDILLIIDKSESMGQDNNIDTARMFCEQVAVHCQGRLMAIACDETARIVNLTGNFKQDFAMIRPGGWTSLGSGLRLAIERNFIPDTVVICTDDAENRPPGYSIYDQFAESQHIFLLTGNFQGASHMAEQKGWNVQRFKVTKDYAALDQVAKLLAVPVGKSLIDRILELKWPVSI